MNYNRPHITTFEWKMKTLSRIYKIFMLFVQFSVESLLKMGMQCIHLYVGIHQMHMDGVDSCREKKVKWGHSQDIALRTISKASIDIIVSTHILYTKKKKKCCSKTLPPTSNIISLRRERETNNRCY